MLILVILQIALIVYTWLYMNKILDSIATVVDKAWDIHDNQPGYMDALQMGVS